MSESTARVVLKGTAKATREVPRSPRSDERGTADVYLRRATPLDDVTSYGRTRPFLSREELSRLHGARPEDVAAVCAFAEEHEFAVASVDLTARRVRVTGSWDALGAAFGTIVGVVRIDGEDVFRNLDELSVPASLAPAIEAVLGLDTTPVVRRHGTFSSGSNSLTVTDVVKRYEFPATTPGGGACDGAGETVALLQFGATFDDSAYSAYLRARGLPVPTVDVRDLVPAPHGDALDSEALGDALMVAQVAPGAKIVEWLATTFDASTVVDAIVTAVMDTTEPATVVSMSYGWFGWSAAEVARIDSAYQDAAALGVTCINSSGDTGSGEGQSNPLANGPQSPADCPHVLAVGGTVVEPDGSEVVWNDKAINLASTGGYSSTFAAPPWQVGVIPAGQTMRGVPDVRRQTSGCRPHPDAAAVGSSSRSDENSPKRTTTMDLGTRWWMPACQAAEIAEICSKAPVRIRSTPRRLTSAPTPTPTKVRSARPSLRRCGRRGLRA